MAQEPVKKPCTEPLTWTYFLLFADQDNADLAHKEE